jgi:hypothetical protein
LSSSLWRESADLELEAGTYELYREGAMSGDFLLVSNGKIVSRGTKPSMWQYNFEVKLGNRAVELRRLSVWRRRFGVFDAGKKVGDIYPVGIFTRRANIELPGDWPLVDRAFLVWLSFLMWKRQSQTAAS